MNTHQSTINALVEVKAEKTPLRDRKMKQITLGCGTVITFDQLETAGISYVPCNYDQPLLKYSHFLDTSKQVTRQSYSKEWNPYKLSAMTGVQIMTGKPTYRNINGHQEFLLDVDIEHRLVERYPNHVQRIIQTYKDACSGVPCVIQTKSGGRRLSGFTSKTQRK